MLNTSDVPNWAETCYERVLTNLLRQLQKPFWEDDSVLEGQQYQMIMFISIKVILT